MTTRFILGVLAYMLPTFPLGYVWHLVLFQDYYEGLAVYRQDLIIPFGVMSMLVQGIAWSFVYSRLFAGEPVVRGAVKFAALALPLAWSFMVLAVAAKHRMASVSGFLLIETAFMAVQYLLVSPLLALVFSSPRQSSIGADARA